MSASKVAIVGAGLSGLVCGTILSKNGIKVTLFDKGRFAGGRLASRERDANTFDYGAQFFTARDSRFRQFLAQHVRDGTVARWNGEFGKVVNGCLSADQVSHARYVGVPHMRALADELAAPLDCRLSHRVTNVFRQNGKWFLKGTSETERGELAFDYGDYDFLLLNLPPVQAAAICPNSKLNELSLRPCCALLLTFEERIKLDFDGIVLDDKVISWVARDSSKPRRPPGERWVIHASPTWSEEYFQEESAKIEKTLINRFATIFNISLPAIHFAKLHKWKFALPISPPAWGCIVESDSALAYWGDWCVSARVEGAFTSGIAAADEIMRSKLGEKGCPNSKFDQN